MPRRQRESRFGPIFIGRGWSTSRVFSRAVEVIRTQGSRALWFKVLGETVYRRMWLFERSLSEPVEPTWKCRDAELADLLPRDVGASLKLRPDRSARELQQRLAGGGRCFVARKSGQVVGQVWAARGMAWSEYLDSPIAIGPDDFFLYEITVLPEFRGQGIAPRLFAHAYEILGRAGGDRAVFAVNLENEAGLRALTGDRARRLGVQGFVGFGRWRRDFFRSGAPSPAATPRASGHGPAYWDHVARGSDGGSAPSASDVLVDLKRRAYGRLLHRWAPREERGLALKTDIFEEAQGAPGFLCDVPLPARQRIGIDISPHATHQAQRRTGAALYAAADVRALPFATGSIGFVLSPSTLDHFADPDDLGRSLREIRRVLAPDGVLILTLDNRQNLLDPLLRLASRLEVLPYYIGRSYTVREMTDELRGAGFDVQETSTLVQHPRLLGVALTRVSDFVGSTRLRSMVHGAFLRAERLEGSRIKYLTGCFVAARAVPRRKAIVLSPPTVAGRPLGEVHSVVRT